MALGDEIGRGGMGTVYLAVTPDDRAVAVKVLRDGLSDPDARRRFRHELEALRRVRGPHLVEVLDADVIGINNRDLTDFSVDVDRTYQLLTDVPAGKTVVSESGFRTREQLEELERVGVDAVLIGESLMRAPDPEAALRELTGS